MKKLWALLIVVCLYGPLCAQEQEAMPYSLSADTLSDAYKRFKTFFYTANEQRHEKPTRALRQLENALDIARQSGDSSLIAACYNHMGIIMKQTGDYTNAQQFYFQALQGYEHTLYQKGIAVTLNNIAMLFHAQNHLIQAVNYFGKAIDALKDEGDSLLLSGFYHNIGETYSSMAEYSKALIFLNKSLAICEYEEHTLGKASIMTDIALVYWRIGQTHKAEEFYNKAIDAQKQQGMGYGAAKTYIAFGEFCAAHNQFPKAYEMINQGLAMAQKIHEKEAILAAYLALSKLEEQTGHAQRALDFHKKYTLLKDSLFNLQRSMLIADTKVKYETEKKEKENELLRREQVIKEGELEIRSKQAIGVSLALLGVFVVAAILYIGNRQKQKANKLLFEQNVLMDQKREEIASQKEDIEAKNSALEKANEALAMKNERITDSLVYGQSVQGAVLPSIHQLKEHFQDAFVIYRPKDIVSGDFYWVAQVRNKVFFAVADCTGHGVPGAFMALLGHAFLHEIILVRKIFSTSDILDAMHETIVGALHQREGVNQDGMTISICAFEEQKNGETKVSFSGAKMDVLYYSSGEGRWEMLEGDRQSIGGYMRNVKLRKFQKRQLLVKPNDLLYFFTDGYPDQANKNFRRFGSSRLIKLIKENVGGNFQEQQQVLIKTLEQHQAHMEQRDDITLIGVSI